MISSRHKPQFPVPATNKAKGVTKVEHLAQELFINKGVTAEESIRLAHLFYDHIENVNQEENNES